MPFGPVLELSSLNGTNGFQISGPTSSYSGLSVASAGDINGDGFDDVIIGSYFGHVNGSNSGTSYVVFGKAGGFAANLNLSALNGANGFQMHGVAANDYSGRSVSSAGDVNGDGFDDLIVGAHGADPNGSFSGASYVVFGKAGSFGANLNLSTLDGTNGFRISGEAGGDLSGASVASAGDVNGDGFDDLLVGAYGADPNGSFSGASYVVFGKVGGFTANLNLSTLDGANGFQINAEAEDDYSGFSVASAGDVNGDGFGDVIIGAYKADPNGSRSGASYVVFGKASGFAADLNLSTLDGTNGFQISGQAAFDFSGYSVSGAGDVNGDGFDDVIIGAYGSNLIGTNSGASYVVFGKAGGFTANFDLAALNGTNGFRINGEAAYDSSGVSVASAGDVNGDGFGDLIVGAYRADPNGSNSGASYVVFGKAAGFGAEINLSTLNGANGFQINGEAADDQSGNSVSSAGDVNGDGFDDILVAAFRADPNGNGSGASYVVFGKASGPINRTGTAEAEFFGGSEFNDTLDGAGGADRLLGNQGSDRLIGGGGNDTLEGGANPDRLEGGAGADRLTGGAGKDTLTGGAAKDFFILARPTDSPPDATRDRVTDFRLGPDQIDLRLIDADPDVNGNQAFTFRDTAGFTGNGGEVRYAPSNGNTLISADIDGDKVADFQILLEGLFTLSGAPGGDFLL